MDIHLQLARNHIVAGEYDQARAILENSDQPKAREWLAKLNEKYPPTEPADDSRAQVMTPTQPMPQAGPPPAPPPAGALFEMLPNRPLPMPPEIEPRFSSAAKAAEILEVVAALFGVVAVLGAFVVATSRGGTPLSGIVFLLAGLLAALLLYLIGAGVQILVSIEYSGRRSAEYLWRLMHRQ